MDIQIKKLKPRQGKIFETLVNSPVFWNLIQEAQNRIKNSKSKFDEERTLFEESEKIIKKLLLPSDWVLTIKRCLTAGKLSSPTIPNCQIFFERNFKTGGTELFLKIFSKTTLKDIERNWKNIRKFQKLLLEIQAKEISEQELQVYKWKKEGKKSNWITSVNGGGITTLTGNSVNQIYRRVKKLLG
ncbi:hypothetical protein COT64_00425 [Candidatus Shapirobacteria bacterium CG09_land_8_20_14_0_10_39_12]|uniref:Uncharacterized protein n=1 Tax=Candidatus Shapirobacteria bacterium CG09_land_8_20_14_0_10_39_12 TaxID=1974885 RepID=A0A2H0WQF9_9BACT|nr:MAG: hypothetical protein COT64_00425 [Candidatus Shapirobacteria bacterium CG09_land_8_20_14_0_10_39_12]